ncbi:hypothetical protein [uncultured Duncaniella sp.]|uniref:hypothetical protein n=1 Tax=uncultured Duncaniella sp. TaxID=2768039 RepID=UPI0025A9D90C|nr:hypothetical protein [uncultured Duncaniella sp.]
MKLTDKRFWIAWAIAELILLASCIDFAVRCQSLGMIYVFAITQPLMIAVALFKTAHPNAALVNLIIINLYTVYSIYLRLTHEDTDGWGWFAFAVVLPTAQLILLLLYWGLEKLAGITKHNK